MGIKTIKNQENLTLFLFIEEETKQQKPKNVNDSTEKTPLGKFDIRRSGDFNSISEIIAEKGEYDMSAIKEMVETLEEDSYQLRLKSRAEPFYNKALHVSSFDEQKQNDFEKIIKYMKKEITKIDSLKQTETDDQKIQKMMKDFFINLKRIELSPMLADDQEEEEEIADDKNVKENIKNQRILKDNFITAQLKIPEIKVIEPEQNSSGKYEFSGDDQREEI